MGEADACDGAGVSDRCEVVCDRTEGVCERIDGAWERSEGVCERGAAGVVGAAEADLVWDVLNRKGDDEAPYMEGGVGEVDGGRGDWWG
jgi:hypothetical protein